MINFIREGGAPAIVILVFSVAAVIAAIRYAWRPNAARLPAIEALCRVVWFSALLGVTMDFYMVTKSWDRAAPDERAAVLVMGLGESLTPLVLGFAFLSVAWMFIALGHRRAQG